MLTSLDYFSVGKTFPAESELQRLQTYEENKKMFEGKHFEVFKDWVRLLRGDKKATMEIVLNWNKRLSLLWADMLLGEAPLITADKQDVVDRLVDENNLVSVAYEVAIDVSRYGMGVFKVRYDDKAVIEAIPPSYLFTIVDPANIKNVQAYVIAWTYSVPTPTFFDKYAKTTYLKCEIHEKGKITNKLFEMKDRKISKELMVEDAEILTGIDEFLVVPVNNLLTSDRVEGIDDYTDLDSIIQEMEIRMAQISRILDEHSDPNMYGSESALERDPDTGEWKFKAGGKFFPVTQGDIAPGYVTWDGKLDAAFKELEVLTEQLYITSETSAAAFGQLKVGLVESGSALRRLMMAPIIKVRRTRTHFDPAIKKLLKVASHLEVVAGRKDASDISKVQITWYDGLPQDNAEQTNLIVTQYQAGLISKESAISNLYEFDSEKVANEIKKISSEKPVEPQENTLK